MGKALIKKSLGSGLYEISYIFNTAKVAKRITELNNKINQLDNVEIPAQEAIVSTAQSSLDAAETALSNAITSGIEEDIVNANTAVIQANEFLQKQERELSYLRLTRTSFSKSVQFLEDNTTENKTEQAWCADFNTELEGEVGSIEIIGERIHAVIIRPGGETGNNSAYTGVTDGNMTPAAGLSPYGWLYNKIKLPGWQKWMSKYRIGTIRKFSTDDPNRCDLDLDPAFSSQQNLNVNQSSRVYNIPIEYLDCNEEVFRPGDRVVVEYSGDKGDNFPYSPQRVIGFESNPRPCGIVLITWEGTTTIDYNRKYYRLRQGEIVEQAALSQWTLTDDGKYNLAWGGIAYDDPDDYTYSTLPTEGAGLTVPETDTGTSIRNQQNQVVRFMTNQSVEDESWTAFEVSIGFVYQFLNMFDSLTRTPYKMKPKTSMCRYVKLNDSWDSFGILTQNIKLEAGPGIILTKFWRTNSFGDSFPWVARNYYTDINRARQYYDFTNSGTKIPSLAASVLNSPTLSGDFPTIIADAFTSGGSQLAEPLNEELYTWQDSIAGSTRSFHRSWDLVTDSVYMIDANTIYGKVIDGDGFTVTSGQQYINNDIKLIYGLTDTQKLDYVRKQKSTEYELHNTSLYIADELIEESDFQPIIALYDDTEFIPAEFLGPIEIRQTEHYPLQIYHDTNFDACVYRKITYVSHESELLPYKTPRWVLSSTIDAQVRRTITTFRINYRIVVNKTITDLDYEIIARESRLTVLSTAYSGPSIPSISGFAFGPWSDVGYDKDGIATSEDNSQITRIFYSATNDNLFVGLDVFPVDFKHDINVTSNILHPEFDNSVLNFPPYIDLEYETPKDRKWLVFNKSGNVNYDITPPSAKRVNGVCMLNPGDSNV
jgi:hypothetical protein